MISADSPISAAEKAAHVDSGQYGTTGGGSCDHISSEFGFGHHPVLVEQITCDHFQNGRVRLARSVPG